jgi:hypothetical protein
MLQHSDLIKPLIVVLLIFAIGQSYFGIFGWGKLKQIQLNDVSGYPASDPCLAKDYCIVTFLAPWCPACHGSLPFLLDLRSRASQQSNVGMKIIVGYDSQENLIKMANKIGGLVLLDENEAFVRGVGRTPVPAWWVIDKAGSILSKGTGLGVSGGSAEENFRYFVKRHLRLERAFGLDKEEFRR